MSGYRIKTLVLALAEKILPKSFLRLVFPGNIRFRYNSFISVEDSIAAKNLYLFLREDSFMEKLILEKGLYGDWERESLKIWAWLAKRSNVILDIGANTGIFSLLAQNNNPAAKIIAVEPVDINYNVLCKNIEKNGFPISAEKVALSHEEGTAKMFMLKDRLNYMTSVNDDRYKDAPHVKGNFEVVEIEVPIRPFSYIAEKHSLQQIDLIKLDVEGHEIQVLESMWPYIEKYMPSVLIEIIGAENALQLDAMFSKLGYQYISINEEQVSKKVDRLWDNNHHNFLLCTNEVLQYLRNKNLVEQV